MSMDTINLQFNLEFIKKIEEICGQKVYDCYQCGRCSAGCPFSAFMDLLPNQVIRFIQLGLQDEVLKAKTPWFCSACWVCATRCPRRVDIPKIMEALRVLILRKKIDIINPLNIDKELMFDCPPQGIISGYMKFSG